MTPSASVPRGTVLVRTEACTGCDLCGNYCPDFAIFGVRLKDLEKLRDKQEKAAAATPPHFRYQPPWKPFIKIY